MHDRLTANAGGSVVISYLMTDEEKAAEIERLERLLAASEAQGEGYRDRKAAITARLEELRGG